ncbi:hypothetical protein [Ruminiclostridium cellulolyticum]|uniref:Uncharacterized protein n=1 Tax=Ruminiclostridium cellulolyticum (strain ATCC 35319 / DSM 5812 / JCM 6584 / H10) TaxID=394503 RepID=B8I0D9_RUMCH|nr:hypothetical protein [Ruminiclostridium cellulolyticum]ACL77465.1 hypothetical protein Ccel_3174 [Ruminiclostridium cellulolyticum H10]
MIKLNVQGETEKINDFMKNLRESNFYFSVTDQSENNSNNISLVVSEAPGKVPDETEFSFRGFIAEWIREGLGEFIKRVSRVSTWFQT